MADFFKDKKNIAILLLGMLFAIKVPQAGARFALWIIAGIVICAATDFFINRPFERGEDFPKSAIISGFILSGILDYRQPWFILVAFAVLAVISKRLLRLKQRHVFNPANLSLFIATLFRIPLSWGIDSNTPLIIIFGIYLVYSYRKFSQVSGFLVIFFGIFSIFRMNPIGLISWFFIFIMLIEPGTSGRGGLKGFVFGGIAGAACFLVFRFLPEYDPFVWSLLFANMSRPAIDKIIP